MGDLGRPLWPGAAFLLTTQLPGPITETERWRTYLALVGLYPIG